MNMAKASDIAEAALVPLRGLSYGTLVGRFVGPGDRCEHSEVRTDDGVTWQVEVQAFWDSGNPGDLRVTAAVDGMGLSAFSPLVRDSIMAPDGSFVGE
jgi:hypothetical protein